MMKKLLLWLMATVVMLSGSAQLTSVLGAEKIEPQVSESVVMIREELQLLSAQDSNIEKMSQFDSYDEVEMCDYEENVTSTLFLLYLDDEYIGYVIVDKETNNICEISENVPTYYLYMSNNGISRDGVEIGYVNGTYFLTDKKSIVYLDEFGNAYDQYFIPQVSRKVITGVIPRLQGPSNCVAAATANLLFYWSNNGYSELNPSSWERMISEVGALFNGYYANNSVPSVIKAYVKKYSSVYKTAATVHWNPVIELALSEIDDGRPCLLGFAADENSPYSKTVGHMTMCCGYVRQGSNSYMMALVDGHSSSIVYKRWSNDYNDCIITAKIY